MRRRVALLAAAALLLAAAPADARKAKRIVTLTPFTANTLAEIGVKPVGVGQVLGGAEKFSSRLAGVPRLPLSHPSGPNMEQLARLRPQLILSAPTWTRGHASMRRLGATVVESSPVTVSGVPAETRRLGRLVGRKRKAERLAKRQEREIADATRGIDEHPTVLLVLGVGRTPYAFMPSSWGGDVVRRAGGRLLTEGLDVPDGFAKISDEVIVARNPDVIIAVPHGRPEDIGRMRDYLQSNPAWRTTRAARTGNVHVSIGGSLLEPWTDVGRIIRDVRAKYLGT
jgi:iron complex transport system substrate-binding protein